MEEKKCEKCNKIFATKYTLKKHIEAKICQEIRTGPIYSSCISGGCEYKTLNKSDLQKHLRTCKYIQMDITIENLRQEHKKEIENLKIEHQREILRLKEEWMQKEQDRFTTLLEKVISKPAITNNTTNNTNNTNNIRGNNNNLQTILATPELYEKQIDPNRIKSIDHSIFEKHFWEGQKGIARFCVENIINTTDENGNNKMLLCCTDPSRKRFKYVNDNNHITDDIEARHFIDAVSKPIVNVCRKVYDGVVKKIEDDKKETEDAFDLNLLEDKTSIAQQKLLEINDIGDHNRNTDYKNEMMILLKK